jgi:predicted AAA+ superfamily ATPase
MHSRHLVPLLLEALEDTPVVYLRGARQCGKSTLMQQLADLGHASEYRTLDDGAELAAATRDPDGYVSGLADRVVLDEVQRAPDLFRAIKRSVDRDRRPGRFLLTGSANALVLPQVSESLAGRMEVLSLYPLSQGEIEGHRESFIDACFAEKFRLKKPPALAWPDLVERIVPGGFPEVLDRKPARRSAWFASYITSILERDVRDLANVQALRELPRLLKLIAARSGGIVNLSDLSRDSQIPLTTLQRHWALLEAVFLVRTLPAWSSNPGSRLIKSPKLYLNDSGLLCHLLGLDAARLKNDDLMTGAALETFVAGEVTKQASWCATRPTLSHFRTQKQSEVDLVLEDAEGRIVGIEVKKTASPGGGDFKGMRALREAAGGKFHRGIVLCLCENAVAFEQNLHAVPIGALWA